MTTGQSTAPHLITVLPPVCGQWRTLEVGRPLEDDGLNLNPAVLKGPVLSVVGLDIKLEQGDESLGCLVQVHAALGAVSYTHLTLPTILLV